MNSIPIPPFKLGPLNPKSANVSGGSQIISSCPVGFRQCGPVQFPLHTQDGVLVLDEHVPRVLPPQVCGKVSFLGADNEHVPPPFWIGFNGCTCNYVKCTRKKGMSNVVQKLQCKINAPYIRGNVEILYKELTSPACIYFFSWASINFLVGRSFVEHPTFCFGSFLSW